MGGHFYVNLGVLATALEPLSRSPKEHEPHIRVRLSRLVDSKETFEKFLDLDAASVSDRQQIAALGVALRDKAVPEPSIRTRQWVLEFTVVVAPPVWCAASREPCGHAPITASACSSQYVMPISRYIIVAVARCSRASRRLPVRR